MSKAVSAINHIYLVKLEGETGHAYKIAKQTDGSTDEGRTYETVGTKDGAEKQAGAYEGSHSLSALMSIGDTYIKKLRKNLRLDEPKRLHVWEIDLSDIENSEEIQGEHSIDVITSIGVSSGAEGNVEVSIETEIDEIPVSGNVTVTPELLAILKRINEEREFKQPSAE